MKITDFTKKKSMNKRQFAEAIAENAEGSGLTPNEALGLIDAVFDPLIRKLVSGEVDRISLTGVGVFEAVEYAEKDAWNLAENTRIHIPARRGVRFRPGASFKAMMRGEKELPVGRSAAMKSPKTKKADDA